MAPAAPWTVKTTKRKSIKNTPYPRKRYRTSLPSEDKDDSRARLRKQQTLTQIQWAPTQPVSYEEGELEPLEVKTEPSNRRTRQVPALKKRNSTLTQMDFLLGKPSIEMSEQDLTPLLVTKEESAAMPQLDGIYDSPTKLRRSKTPVVGARPGSHRKRKTISLPAEESQEYLSMNKRRKDNGNAAAKETSPGRRRRSGRNTSKLPSDPIENFAVFHEALADVTPRWSRPTLEIEDSTGLDEDLGDVELVRDEKLSQSVTAAAHNQADDMNKEVQVLPASPKKIVPRTPRKERHYIPSSQSPESLPPSTRRKDVTSHSMQITTSQRNPLVELSINTPTRRHVARVDDYPSANFTSERKICTLKLPRVSLGPMKRRVEDSQADIWAVQPTSSPKSKGNGQTPPDDVLADAPVEEEQPEIPSTSQAQNDAVITSSPPEPAAIETQESLMSLSAIFGINSKEIVDTSNENKSQQASAGSNVQIRDFVTHPHQTQQKETQYVAFLQTQPEQFTDADEFGSPFANDTQFAAHLAHIPTSPLGTSGHMGHVNPQDTIRVSSSPSPEATTLSSPFPAPKLVDRVEYQESITTVPTKDLSSPALPPMPPPTQRIEGPASLPHPSQISTQEPSQQLPQLSSVPQRSPYRTQRITIKDSSSMHEHLSQLPEYNEDELQLQRELEGTQHQVFGEDDYDDEVNDDLDPKTPRKTVRFEQPLERAEPPEEDTSVEADSPSRSEEHSNRPDPSPPANFTQNGHVTAACIEDMRKRGLIPPGYNPPAYKVPSPRELLPAWMFEDDDDEL